MAFLITQSFTFTKIENYIYFAFVHSLVNPEFIFLHTDDVQNVYLNNLALIKNLLIIIFLLYVFPVLGQMPEGVDSLSVNSFQSIPDSLTATGIQKPDSVAKKKKPVLEAAITYSAKDSTIVDLENQRVYMYKEGVVTYQNIELKADYIELNLATKEVYAEGLPDSTGTKVGTPVFKEGSDEFESQTLRYSFETQKGIITDVKTAQGDGFVHSERTKKIGKDEFLLQHGKYTTCDADHPHFYLRMSRAKVISNKKIITGPAYMVLEDFPIYFPMIPFGYFPNSTTYSSGILIPTYGEENSRGFFLRDGGYYWAANEFFDLTVQGDIYSKGSWGTSLGTNYKKRYKYSGSFKFDYNLNKTGDEPKQSISKGFQLVWTHSQDSKANPSQSFSASVNLSTSSYDRENATTITNYLQTQKSSSISYAKTFENSPFNMSINLRHSQNSTDSTMTLGLPEMTFNMSKINPFKAKKRVGPTKWYEQIGLSYSGNIRNTITAKENEILKKSLVKDWQNGMKHSIPITLPSFNLLKFINVSPSFSYSERWYTSYVKKEYDLSYGNPKLSASSDYYHVRIDTLYGFKRNYDYSYSLSASTNIYGMYQMRNPDSKIKAIRHKVTPSVSFSYRPDFGQSKYGFWDSYVDSTGKVNYYTYFENGIYGYTSRGASGSINFSISNNLEAKVLDAKNDSTKSGQAFKKVKIIDNLSASASYNLIADSLNLSTISLNGRTTIKGVSVNFGGILDPYMVNEKGVHYNEYVWNHAQGLKKLGTLRSANMSFGMSFDSQKGKKEAEANKKAIEEEKKLPGSYSEYVDFNIPWSFNFNYSMTYSKPLVPSKKSTIMQSLNFSGQLSLTEKWKMNMNTNFDVQAMKFSFTTFNVTRTLHCWSMSFNFVPFGDRKSYSFNLSASSSMLRDLKLSKQRSWYDK